MNTAYYIEVFRVECVIVSLPIKSCLFFLLFVQHRNRIRKIVQPSAVTYVYFSLQDYCGWVTSPSPQKRRRGKSDKKNAKSKKRRCREQSLAAGYALPLVAFTDFYIPPPLFLCASFKANFSHAKAARK